MHTTNYIDAFISVAEDCPGDAAVIPPERAAPTAARLQYDLLVTHPYRYTSDELLLAVGEARNPDTPEEAGARRAAFFAKGQPCLRTSPLARRYGWGIHHDGEGRVALFPRESEEYRRLDGDAGLKQVRAMRGGRGR